MELQYQEFRNQLIKDVTTTYYELSFIDNAIKTTEKNAVLLQQFTQIAETRYRVGKGLQQDVLRSQVELYKIKDKIIRLKQNREKLAAQLNTLLNRNPEIPVGATNVAAEPDTMATFDSSNTKTLAHQNRPLLLSWQLIVNQSNQKVKLAKKGYLPDFSIGISYTQRDELTNGMGGVDYLSGAFNVTLPLYFWKKQNKSIEENQLNELSMKQQYESVKRQVERELEIKLSELKKNTQLLKLYKSGIITQASQALQSALAAYQVDRVDFLTLINNQMTLFNYELEYYRILSDYYKNLAELEALIGKRL